MAAYSIDLRQKILHAYERRPGSQRALADVFGVSLSFIEKVLRRYRTTGEVGPKPHAGGQKPRVDAAAQALVRQRVHACPDATLAALSAHVADTVGVRVSLATMCRLDVWVEAVEKPPIPILSRMQVLSRPGFPQWPSSTVSLGAGCSHNSS
jgi:transposase